MSQSYQCMLALVCSVLIALAGSVRAAETELPRSPLNLEEALNLAWKKNASLKVSRLEQLIAGQEVVRARSGYLPKVDARTTHTFYDDPVKFRGMEIGGPGGSHRPFPRVLGGGDPVCHVAEPAAARRLARAGKRADGNAATGSHHGGGNLAAEGGHGTDVRGQEDDLERPRPPPGSAEGLELQALPTEDGKSLLLYYEDTARQGVYRLHLERRDGSAETEHVAVNVDPAEGDLKPADRRAVRRLLGDAKRPSPAEAGASSPREGGIEVVAGHQFLARGTSGARVEIWRAMLFALVAALCIEQALAWWFGTRRG